MTTGECSCLISFTWAPLTCSERGGSDKFKMKICVSSGIRTHTTPVHDMDVSALDRSTTPVRYQVEYYSLTIFWYMNTNGYVTVPVWNRLWFEGSVNNIILAKIVIEISLPSYVIYISQLVWVTRQYTCVFIFRSSQWYRYHMLRNALWKDLRFLFTELQLSVYDVMSFQEYVTKEIHRPVFCDDHENKLSLAPSYKVRK